MTDHRSDSNKPEEASMDRTVAVTGGSGKLGRAVVAALIQEGWTVINFDRLPSSDSRARFIRADLTDYGQVVEALSGIDEVHRGVDTVVHLAAIPGATFAPNVATLDNNLVSTFHASRPPSCSTFTTSSGRPARRSATRSTPRPHPFRSTKNVLPSPEVVYALAKDLEEEMARQ
jgi:nucleoside-diphosphate-sugar epimerase